MTEQLDSERDPIAEAIEALTVAAQDAADGKGSYYDFGEIACHVITSVAANMGGAESLLSGRPGSWEADLVRQIVGATAREEDLLERRTAPLVLHIDAILLFDEFGLLKLQMQDESTVKRRVAAGSRSAEEIDALDEQIQDMEELFDKDLNAYVEAYAATARRLLSEKGSKAPVEVVRIDDYDLNRPQARWDAIADQIQEQAKRLTLLPITGAPPVLPAERAIEELRAAGLSYLERVNRAKE